MTPPADKPQSDPPEHPGAASGGAADPFELLRRFWAPLGVPVPPAATPAAASGPLGGMPGASFIPPMAFPTVDPAEIEKRIADLRSVEGWLALNIEVVRATIQTLEAQRTTLAAFQSMQSSMSETLKAQAAQVAQAADSARAFESKLRRPRKKKTL